MHNESKLTALREHVRRLERHYAPTAAACFYATGFASIDAHLGGGLPCGALHEFFDTSGHASHTARFIAMLLGRHPGRVFWIGGTLSNLYAAGLSQHGLDPARVTCIEADDSALSGICEDALRVPHNLATIIERPQLLQLTASRRLQLAVEKGGGLGILLYHDALPDTGRPPPTTSVTRWHIDPQPCQGPTRSDRRASKADPDNGIFTEGPWRFNLLRHRGGRPGHWSISPHHFLNPMIHDTTHPSRVASTLAH